jgi:hypothetical protein
MRTILQRESYEKLIGQIVYIEENMQNFQDALIKSKLLATRTDARLYFENYIKKVEALFEDISITMDRERQNRIPFIVLGSSFTLCDINNRVYYCHLAYDNLTGESRSLHQIYFLSEAGITLLSKSDGSTVTVNMGKGYLRHKISSVRIVS